MKLDPLQVVLWFIVINVTLSMCAAGLDRIKNHTVNKVDNKIASFLNKSSKILRSAIDLVTGNMKH